MEKKEFVNEWTNKHTLKSVLWYLMHYVIFVVLAALLLIGDKLPNLKENWTKEGGNYLYAIFGAMLLFIITYLYFFFENREMLINGKTNRIICTKDGSFRDVDIQEGLSMERGIQPIEVDVLAAMTGI